ncbi:unnamed protein product [Schistosoma turkestanicum]|nr:unnamed protein product [Schistosoma turkestanicum]
MIGQYLSSTHYSCDHDDDDDDDDDDDHVNNDNAQVLPKHLRDQGQFTDINTFDHATTFQSDILNDLQHLKLNNLKTAEHKSSSNNNDELIDRDSITQQCIAPLSIGESLQPSSSTNSLASSLDSNTSLSTWNSSEAYSYLPDKSEEHYYSQLNSNSNNRSIHSLNNTNQLKFEKNSLLKSQEQLHHSNHANKFNWSSDLPQKSKKVGQHIKKFLHRLMTNSKSHIAEQINLFLECTKASSDRGPYRTMQSCMPCSTIEFINPNEDVDLDSGIREQGVNTRIYWNTDFSNLQIKVHKLCDPQIQASDLGIQALIAPPNESLIQYVIHVYTYLTNTYSVQRKINYLVNIFNYIRKSIYNVESGEEFDANTLSIEDLQAYYAWVFARSGLLATIPNATDNHDLRLQTNSLTNNNNNSNSNNTNQSIICPIALQADYLDGVLNTPLLNDQATGLNDLFGTLYWIWNDKNALHQSTSPLLLTQKKFPSTEKQNSVLYSKNKQGSQFFVNFNRLFVYSSHYLKEIHLEDELRIAEFTSLNSDMSYSLHLLPTITTITTTNTKSINIPLSRSRAGTPNPIKDQDTHPCKSHTSISSRSDSTNTTTTTSSSSELRSKAILSRQLGKSNRNRTVWWTMCGSNGQTKNQLDESMPDSDCKNTIEYHENLTSHKPILVYKRKSGYFALSDRLLGLELKSTQPQNSEAFPSDQPPTQ